MRGVRGDRKLQPQNFPGAVHLSKRKVGGFIWPADRAREGDVDTILASVSSNASLRQPEAPPTSSVMMSARSTMDHERAEEEKVAAAEMQNHQQQRPDQRGNAHDPITGRSSGSSSVLSGASTWRSDATAVLSSRSRNSPKWLSSRSSSCSGNSDKGSGDSRRRVPRATSHAKANGAVISGHVFRRSGANSTSSARENRLRPQSIRSTAADTLQERVLRQGLSSPSPSIPRLDPVFSKHHKYDLVAHTRGACGAEITGRFGPVNEDSVMAASLLTSELSTPWSHVLRGQKW